MEYTVIYLRFLYKYTFYGSIKCISMLVEHDMMIIQL